MDISIKDLIHKYASTSKKTWLHDRTQTVGASEVGACMRKTWFSKHSAPHDDAYVDDWGARVRGTIMEEAFIVPAIREILRGTEYELHYAGEKQITLRHGYLSGTPDGLLFDIENGLSIECVNLEFKTIDPRADISKEKSQHHFQVQAQMGLWRDCTKYKPEYSIITYVNASFWDVIDEFKVEYDPRIYAQAHERAQAIMTATSADELPPEGKQAGGSECKHCPWASHCQDIVVAGVPRGTKEISDDDAVKTLKGLRDLAIAYSGAEDKYAEQNAKIREEIKQFLREHGTRSVKGDDWGVTYSVSAGRSTLDFKDLEASGIDLEPFRKQSKPSERLTVK